MTGTIEYGQPANDIAERIEQALQDGDWRRATQASDDAIGRGLRHPLFFVVRGQQMEAERRLPAALDSFEQALVLAPHDVRIHDAIAVCAVNLEAYDRAIAAFDALLSLEPASAQLHYRRGLVWSLAGDQDKAECDFRMALRLDAEFPEALASLAGIMARKGGAQAARELGTKALAIKPNLAEAAEALVLSDLSERRYADAERRLADWLGGGKVTGTIRATLLNMLGDALDGQNRYDEAFGAYKRGNEELKARYSARFAANQGTEAARALTAYFENAPRWRTDDNGNTEGGFEGHVFLLGFMRSGTTLLEQVLAANPEIVALEEKGLLSEPSEEYLTSVPGLSALAALGPDELARQRRLYWDRVRGFLPDSTARLFVDKQPLNTSKLPLIARLFPGAKIIFALRDPRDVVLSCFRRNLRVTASQYEFLSLPACARFYSSVMRLAEVYREKLPLDVFEHRYEAMVNDFDGRIRALCDFIGVEWTDAMQRFNERAPVAGLRSPSAAQIRRPIYGEGIGQWRRYAPHLAPILPILEPWVEKFGYPRD